MPQAPVFSIRIAGCDMVVPCRSDERVLIALEQAVPFPGIPPVRVGCRKGGCGACRIRVLSGTFEAAKMSRAHVSDEDRESGHALACRVSPTSDMTIEAAFVGPEERLARRQGL